MHAVNRDILEQDQMTSNICSQFEFHCGRIEFLLLPFSVTFCRWSPDLPFSNPHESKTSAIILVSMTVSKLIEMMADAIKIRTWDKIMSLQAFWNFQPYLIVSIYITQLKVSALYTSAQPRPALCGHLRCVIMQPDSLYICSHLQICLFLLSDNWTRMKLWFYCCA